MDFKCYEEKNTNFCLFASFRPRVSIRIQEKKKSWSRIGNPFNLDFAPLHYFHFVVCVAEAVRRNSGSVHGLSSPLVTFDQVAISDQFFSIPLL